MKITNKIKWSSNCTSFMKFKKKKWTQNKRCLFYLFAGAKATSTPTDSTGMTLAHGLQKWDFFSFLFFFSFLSSFFYLFCHHTPKTFTDSAERQHICSAVVGVYWVRSCCGATVIQQAVDLRQTCFSAPFFFGGLTSQKNWVHSFSFSNNKPVRPALSLHFKFKDGSISTCSTDVEMWNYIRQHFWWCVSVSSEDWQTPRDANAQTSEGLVALWRLSKTTFLTLAPCQVHWQEGGLELQEFHYQLNNSLHYSCAISVTLMKGTGETEVTLVAWDRSIQSAALWELLPAFD